MVAWGLALRRVSASAYRFRRIPNPDGPHSLLESSLWVLAFLACMQAMH